MGVIIDEPDSPTTTVHGLKYGKNYFFQWNLADIGCGPTSSQTTVHVYSEKPYIGPDLTICEGDSCTTIMSQTVLPIDAAFTETAQWSSNQSLFFSPVDGRETRVCNLQPGANVIYWTTNGDVCGNQSRDTITVNFNRVPTANDDVFDVNFGEQILINVLQNDILPPNVTVNITSPPTGNLDTVGIGQFYYQPLGGYSGTDQMIYEVCNVACTTGQEACATATVKFNVGDAIGCPLPTLITPNEHPDDVNDALVFPCLIGGEGQMDGESELTVFNQWGNEVFHAAPYANDWQGTYNGEPLPVGTYFYILRASYLSKPVSRFVLIQR